jgi:hypothetical protein
LTRTIRVLADYHCHALWIVDGGRYENTAPRSRELGLSDSLIGDLDRWASEYTATLCDDDPLSSGFESESAESDFIARGRILALRLKQELGVSWSVTYFDGELRRDIMVD